MVDLRIVLEVEGDGPAVVEQHGHVGGANALHPAKAAILDAEAAFVVEEQDPVPGSEDTLTTLGPHLHLFAQLSGLAQPLAGKLVELLDLVAGVAQDQA
ncbi:hypothetical protein GCM10022281_14970 [Sphingomonas rosea]|uniref:Uncharacterized protein n=1 Tax=Sphingomonas rosea TaxID=335605 RepID=A0ABP7U3Q2_9SPHN